MKKNRRTDDIKNLCNGPGKVCQALGIDKKYNGLELGNKIKLFDDNFKITKIQSSSRIGIKDDQHLQWRFYIKMNSFVSKK